jgi:glycerol-3-phosphate dehydrogenase (NAD(P)+)
MSAPAGIGVIGDGRLALAMAHLSAQHGTRVWLYAPDKALRKHLRDHQCHPGILPEVDRLDDRVKLVRRLGDLAKNVRLIFMTSAPTRTKGILDAAGDLLNGGHQLLHAVHRLHGESLETTAEIIRERTCILQIGAFAGPLHVGELLDGQANAAVVGSPFPDLIRRAREAFTFPNLTISESRDLTGVELAASLVQVVALLVGLSDGLELGAATHATLMIRGLDEMVGLGDRLGASSGTFYGVAGLAKLIDGARRGEPHYDVGKMIAHGIVGDELDEMVPAEAVGFRIIRQLRQYAEAGGFDLPITTTLDEIAGGRADPVEGLSALLRS